jgi:hypothetical protein
MTSAEISNRMIQVISVAALVMITAGAVYYRSSEVFLFALGVLLTSALNVARLTMLRRSVEKAVHMDLGKDAGGYMRLQFLLRFLLLAAVLVITALSNITVFWGAVAGVFTMQIANHSLHFFYRDMAKEARKKPEPKAQEGTPL